MCKYVLYLEKVCTSFIKCTRDDRCMICVEESIRFNFFIFFFFLLIYEIFSCVGPPASLWLAFHFLLHAHLILLLHVVVIGIVVVVIVMRIGRVAQAASDVQPRPAATAASVQHRVGLILRVRRQLAETIDAGVQGRDCGFGQITIFGTCREKQKFIYILSIIIVYCVLFVNFGAFNFITHMPSARQTLMLRALTACNVLCAYHMRVWYISIYVHMYMYDAVQQVVYVTYFVLA